MLLVGVLLVLLLVGVLLIAMVVVAVLFVGVLVVLLLVGVLVVGVLLVVLLLAGVLVVAVVVSVLAELDRRDGADGFEGRDTLGLGALDDVEQTLLEAAAVDDQRVSVHDPVDFLRRGLEVVRIGTDGHDGHDLGRLAEDLTHDVTEDVGGDDDRRTLGVVGLSGLVARCRFRGLVGGRRLCGIVGGFGVRRLGGGGRGVLRLGRILVGSARSGGQQRETCKCGDERAPAGHGHIRIGSVVRIALSRSDDIAVENGSHDRAGISPDLRISSSPGHQ